MGTVRCSRAGIIRLLYGILCWIFRKNGSQGEGICILDDKCTDPFLWVALKVEGFSKLHIHRHGDRQSLTSLVL